MRAPTVELVLRPARGLTGWLRGRALVIVAGLVLVYFGYHAVHGQRGLLAWLATSRDYEVARAQLARLEAERAALQAQVDGLRPDRLDPDLLEGKLRELGYIRPDELIVFGPGAAR